MIKLVPVRSAGVLENKCYRKFVMRSTERGPESQGSTLSSIGHSHDMKTQKNR